MAEGESGPTRGGRLRARRPLLQLSGVRHGYGERPVLNDIDLVLEAGDGVALTGPNGSGKSTLLRLAAGREQPSAGRITHRGTLVSEDRRDIRAAFATALDKGADYPDLSVREHLLLVALAHGLAEDADETVDEALTAHRLADHARSRPAELSSGLRQLLALATTAVRPYQLLLLDEPEQHLDTEARRALAERLNDARDRRAAVLLATHDHQLAGEVADRVLTVTDGCLRPDEAGDEAPDGAGDFPRAGVAKPSPHGAAAAEESAADQ